MLMIYASYHAKLEISYVTDQSAALPSFSSDSLLSQSEGSDITSGSLPTPIPQ